MKRSMRSLGSMAIVFALMFSLCAGCITAGAASNVITEAPDVRVIIAGEEKTYPQVPVIINGSTFLPLRALAASLGIPNDDQHIIWNQQDKSVTLKSADDARTVFLSIGSLKGRVNDAEKTLNAAPVLYKNSTYIPLRFVADAMDMTVLWDAPTRTVYIRDFDEYNEILLALSSARYSRSGSSLGYTKEYLEKKVTVKNETVLDFMREFGEYQLKAGENDIDISATVTTEYKRGAKEVEKFATTDEGIEYSLNGKLQGILNEEAEKEFVTDVLKDLGLYSEPDDGEEDDTETPTQTGGLEYLEKLAMFCEMTHEDGCYTVVMPYGKVEDIGDYEYYNRTFVIDDDTWFLKKTIDALRLPFEEDGVAMAYDVSVTIEFDIAEE